MVTTMEEEKQMKNEIGIYTSLESVSPGKTTYSFGSFTPYLALEKEGSRNPYSKDRMLWIEYRYKFPNGFGASIARNAFTGGHEMGLFEVAVMKGGNLYYKTEVTDDVIGCCDADDVARVLTDIASLDKKGRKPKPVTRKVKKSSILCFTDFDPTDAREIYLGYELIGFRYDYEFDNGYGVVVSSEDRTLRSCRLVAYEYSKGIDGIKDAKSRGVKEGVALSDTEIYLTKIAGLPDRKAGKTK